MTLFSTTENGNHSNSAKDVSANSAYLLVVDDDESVALTVSEVLRQDGFYVETASSGKEAAERLDQSQFDLVLTDLHMADGDGLTVLAEVHRRSPLTITIVLTGFASLESAIAALRQGAYDYLLKPCIIDDLRSTVRRGLEHRRLMQAEQDARVHLEQLNRDLEKRVEERTAELKRLNEELAQANRAKDIFFATLSHELRTPLTPVLGWVKLLKTGPVDEELLAQGLEAIERNARLQARLIDDLLDISRIVSGKLRIEREPTDLNTIVEAAIETVRSSAISRNVELDVKLDNNPVIVQGSPVRLQQVIWNLLSNAIKFTEPGGRVSVGLEHEGEEIRVVVTDTGVGIAPDFLPHVFDLFRQADGSTTRQHGGLGLGLAIVRALAELHGGWVKAESEGKGKGSRFIFSIPCAVTARMAKASESQSMTLEMDHSVLVVEDSPDTLTFLEMLLKRKGCRVMSASSAVDALKLVDKETPSLIISDIGMPEVDGYELLTQLRRRKELKKVPAIAISGYAMEEDRMRSLAAGYAAHMAKPVDPEELMSLIQQLVTPKSKGEGSGQ
jgi:signal transduction histidine kinase